MTLKPRQYRWPDDAKIACTFSVAFEAFVHHSQYASAHKRFDPSSIAFGEFGGRTGVWRALDILDRNGVKGTFSTNGLAAQKFPEAVQEISRRGHEVVAHGWNNDAHLDEISDDEQRRHIHDTVEIIEKTSGKRPTGWVGPGHRRTSKTFGWLMDEGIRWTGDVPLDEVPSDVITEDGRRIVAIPFMGYVNDLGGVYRPNRPPSTFLDAYRDIFDYLYAEGERGYPAAHDSLIHAHIGARALNAGNWEKTMRYAKTHTDVCFCSKGDLAAWHEEIRDELVGQPPYTTPVLESAAAH